MDRRDYWEWMPGEESTELSAVERPIDISGAAQVKGKVPGSRAYRVEKEGAAVILRKWLHL